MRNAWNAVAHDCKLQANSEQCNICWMQITREKSCAKESETHSETSVEAKPDNSSGMTPEIPAHPPTFLMQTENIGARYGFSMLGLLLNRKHTTIPESKHVRMHIVGVLDIHSMVGTQKMWTFKQLLFHALVDYSYYNSCTSANVLHTGIVQKH